MSVAQPEPYSSQAHFIKDPMAAEYNSDGPLFDSYALNVQSHSPPNHNQSQRPYDSPSGRAANGYGSYGSASPHRVQTPPTVGAFGEQYDRRASQFDTAGSRASGAFASRRQTAYADPGYYPSPPQQQQQQQYEDIPPQHERQARLPPPPQVNYSDDGGDGSPSPVVEDDDFFSRDQYEYSAPYPAAQSINGRSMRGASPPPPPAPLLDHSHLRPGNQASLLSHEQTLELYRANAKKTQDPEV